MAKRVVFDTQEAKEFTKVFAQFCSRRSAWSAWSDYITLTACSISVVVIILLSGSKNGQAFSKRPWTGTPKRKLPSLML